MMIYYIQTYVFQKYGRISGDFKKKTKRPASPAAQPNKTQAFLIEVYGA